ncbi:MAG TPA: hypothetical protein EYG92_09295 [Lutibacter sp.]|nr:hypothetical protein [Lutibacter sp.]
MRIQLLILVAIIFTQGVYSQENLRMLSWNIKNFGHHKTHSQIEQIASVITEYDVVAMQQIDAQEHSAEKALAQLIIALNKKGFDWSYTLSQPTKAKSSSKERYAFLWKTNKVNVLGKGTLLKPLQRKVLQEPFVLKIEWNSEIVSLYNYHAKSYDKHPEKEIAVVLDYLKKTNTPFVLFGSFNTTENNEVFGILDTTTHKPVVSKKKTLLKNYCYSKTYKHLAVDNIYYTSPNFTLLSSGVLDYVGACENLKLAHRISNHIPVVAHLQSKQTSYEVSFTTNLNPSP